MPEGIFRASARAIRRYRLGGDKMGRTSVDGQNTTGSSDNAADKGPGLLDGDTTCALLITSQDWSATPLGPIERWPQSLQTMTAVLLRSPLPMVILWGPDGILLYNEAYAKVAGQRHPQILGSKVAEAWPEAAEFNANVLRTVLAGGTLSYRNEELALSRNGRAERAFFDLDYSPIPGADGRPQGVLAVVRDTTKAVLDQRALEAAQEKLRDLNADLSHAVERAIAERAEAMGQLHETQKLDTIGQLTGGFAHDFNNLLTPIVAGLDIVRRKLPDERSQRLISAALQSSQRAALLVQRLLAFAGRQMLQPRPVSPSGLVEGMRDLIDQSVGQGIEVRVEVAPDLPAILVDPAQLEVALLNLSVNARDAMPRGGRLTITAEEIDTDEEPVRGLSPGRYVSIAVSDTGTGMDEITRQRAVEPFFTTKGQGQGIGLGLSMVHGLATQSGGTFRLLSEVGRGTAAVLYLPAAQETFGTDEDEDGVSGAPRRPIVLLVDDEELVRLAMAEGLRELGYDVEEVGTAAEALDAVRMGFVPDALVTDHVMPGMTGAELAKEVRERLPNLPVLMITGYAQLTPEQTRGLDVLAKPFRQSDLATRLAVMLAESTNVVPLRARS